MADDFMTEESFSTLFETHFKAQPALTLAQVHALSAFTWIEAKFEDGPNRTLLLLESLKRSDVTLLVADVANPSEGIWVEPSQVVRSLGRASPPIAEKKAVATTDRSARRPQVRTLHDFVRTSLAILGVTLNESLVAVRTHDTVRYYVNVKKNVSQWTEPQLILFREELDAMLNAAFKGIRSVAVGSRPGSDVPASIVVRLTGTTVTPR